MTYLVLDGLVKRFPSRERGGAETVAVDGVSLAIDRGEMVTLLGPSGCGKTTTLRMIAGFETPTEGRISLDGSPIQDLPPHRRGMAMVFQSYALFPHLTVYENVGYGLRVQRRPDKEVRERVATALDLVGLRGYENRAPNQLSGGQQQRVALARALVVGPRVLLFDEPLSNLDAGLREQMRVQIRQLQRRLGITAVYVTHDQAEAMVLSDRVVVMEGGAVRQAGPPDEVYRRPAGRFVAGFLGRANFLPARVVVAAPGGDPGGTTVDVYGVRFPARGPAGAPPAPPGAAVTVVLRPEAVAVAPRPDGDSANGPAPGSTGDTGGTLRATVRRAVFLGPLVEYEVGLDPQGDENGTTVLVHDRSPDAGAPLPEGTPVLLRPLVRELYFLTPETETRT